MFCNKCGKEITEGIMCKACSNDSFVQEKEAEKSLLLNGKAIELLEKSIQIEEQKRLKKEKRKKRKSKFFKTLVYILLAVIVLSIIAGSVYLVVGYNQGETYQRENKFYDAYSQYHDTIGLNFFTESKQIQIVQQAVDANEKHQAIKCFSKGGTEIISKVTIDRDFKEDWYKYIVKKIKSSYDNCDTEKIDTYIKIFKIHFIGYKDCDTYVKVLSDIEYRSMMETAEILKNNIYTSLPNEDIYKISKDLLTCGEVLVYFLSGETTDNQLYTENKTVDWICAWWDDTSRNHNSFYFTRYEKNGSIRCFKSGSWFDENMSDEGAAADFYDLKSGIYYHQFEKEKNIDDIAEFTIEINSVDQITLTSCTTGKTIKLYRYNNILR